MSPISTKKLQRGKEDISSVLAHGSEDTEGVQPTRQVKRRQRVRILNVPIDSITRQSDVQTRTVELDVEHNEEDARFVRSVQKHGVITPIKLRPLDDGEFQLVVGHRRYAACQHLGVSTIPAVIADANEDADELILQTVIENAHRKDLTDVEKASLVQELSERGLSQRQIAEELNCSQGHISLLTKLLEDTDSDVLELVQDEKIGAYYASAIMSLSKDKRKTAIEGVQNDLSVDDAIQLAQGQKGSTEDDSKVSTSRTKAKAENPKKAAEQSTEEDVHLAKIAKSKSHYEKIVALSKAKKIYMYALAGLVEDRNSFEDGLAAYESMQKAIIKKLDQAMLANAKLAIVLSISNLDFSESDAITIIKRVFESENKKEK